MRSGFVHARPRGDGPTNSSGNSTLPEQCARIRALALSPTNVYGRRPNVIWSFYRHTRESNAHHQHYAQIIVCSEYVRRDAVISGFSCTARRKAIAIGSTVSFRDSSPARTYNSAGTICSRAS